MVACPFSSLLIRVNALSHSRHGFHLLHLGQVSGSPRILLQSVYSSFTFVLSDFSSQAPTSGDQSVLPTPCADRAALPFFQVANFGLPLAAIADLNKDEEVISGTMTATLAFYSSVLPLLVPRRPD